VGTQLLRLGNTSSPGHMRQNMGGVSRPNTSNKKGMQLRKIKGEGGVILSLWEKVRKKNDLAELWQQKEKREKGGHHLKGKKGEKRGRGGSVQFLMRGWGWGRRGEK